MKRCPQCSRDYNDPTLSFCLDDGTPLLDGPASRDEPATAILPSPSSGEEDRTRLFNHSGDGTAGVNSIAVLPFSNISADPENDYFCDGLAEELLNALSKIEGLKVAARTSSFSFRDAEAKVSEIGRALDVKTVLEGGVRKAGEQVRVSVQLVSADDGFQIWSERYDRVMDDIFAVQDEIAMSVVEALKVKLLGEEKSKVLKRYTENTEAYQLYLQARHQFFKLTPEGMSRAIELFETALEADPDYAPALAWLGHSYGTLVVFGGMPPQTGLPKMAAAIGRALEIDEDLDEAQFAFAMAKMQGERDWETAERAFRRAIDLNPGHANARAQYGILLASLGRDSEAIEQAERALEIDPLGVVTNLDVGMTFWILEDYDRVSEIGNTVVDLDHNFFGGHMMRSIVAWEQGDLSKAIENIEKAVPLGLPYGKAFPACLYGIAGDTEKANEMLIELMNPEAGRPVFAASLAIVHAGLGDLDATFEHLEAALENGEAIPFTSLIRQLPEVAGDPRYHEMLERVGLPASER